MKKIYFTLFSLAAMVVTGNALAQLESYTVFNFPDSINSCQESFYLEAHIGANDESEGILTVDWGDGSSSNQTFAGQAGETLYFYMQHGYSLAGAYTVTVNGYSTTNGANVDAGQSLNVNANDPSNCGYIFISTFQSSPNMWYQDAVYDFTGADGTVTTVSQSGNPNNFNGYSGLNTANGPYTVSINDAWLAANGLVQVSADFTITSFNSNGMATPSQVSMEVDCAVNAPDPDMVIQYAYSGPFVAPWQTGNIGFNVCNYACNNSSDALVSVTFPAILTPDVSNLPGASVNGNVISIPLTGLSSCEYIYIPFTFPGSVLAGTELEFYVNVNAANDTNLSNNNDTIYTTVLNSYDPNNKLVDKPTSIDANSTETLQYVINFQNEGNFSAVDVVIQDTISENLDLSTFTVLGSKHGIATSVNTTTRVVTFSFNNINLVPASQDEEGSKGFVVYSIRENQGLPIGAEIENTAYIYFDFNAPIITNTTYNVNQVLSVESLQGETIVMYPNPATTSVRFNGAAVLEANVFDLSGKLVLNAVQPIDNELSVTELNDGIYQIQIITEKGVYTQKLVVKK